MVVSTSASRYVLHDEIAVGGMASVHFGRLVGQAGFSRVVAIKRLHPQFARDPEFCAMLLDEARMTSRVRHANVAAMLDVIHTDRETMLVMEYVAGEALSRLLKAGSACGRRLPVAVAVAIACNVLEALHAAHEATNDQGEPLGLVHRDVSPQNVLVGVDGVTRLVDFGIAKARGRCAATREGDLKGKLAYMAPEQLTGGQITRRTDIWAAGVVLWEMLVGRPLFGADSEGVIWGNITSGEIKPPSKSARLLPSELDPIVLRALSRDPARRFETALEMARALEAQVRPAATAEVAQEVEALAGTAVAERARRLAELERSGSSEPPTSIDGEVTIPDPSPSGGRGRRKWVLGGAAAMLVAVLGALGAARASNPQTRVVLEATLGTELDATTWSDFGSAEPLEPLEVPAPPEASSATLPPANAQSPRPRRPTTGARGSKQAGQRQVDEKCLTMDEPGVWTIRRECL